MTEKRFKSVYNEQSIMMQYVDTQKEEPNRWAIWNVNETLQKMNELNYENEQLKHQNELLSDELEQCKAVIDKRWSEYLKQKELEND